MRLAPPNVVSRLRGNDRYYDKLNCTLFQQYPASNVQNRPHKSIYYIKLILLKIKDPVDL